MEKKVFDKIPTNLKNVILETESNAGSPIKIRIKSMNIEKIIMHLPVFEGINSEKKQEDEIKSLKIRFLPEETDIIGSGIENNTTSKDIIIIENTEKYIKKLIINIKENLLIRKHNSGDYSFSAIPKEYLEIEK
jgi:hypothetical protein